MAQQRGVKREEQGEKNRDRESSLCDTETKNERSYSGYRKFVY